MSSPVNTLSSYDLRGIREDIEDLIYDISPEETPFLSKCARGKASNTYHEWQTDALAAPADNAHIEGDDTIADLRAPTTRLGNYTQIFKKAVAVSGTDAALNKAGRGREMAYQIRKAGKEIKRDIETAMFANQARVAGDSATPRRMAGVPAWIKTTTTNVGGGGSDPTGDGTNARTDGSATAFSQPDFDQAMQDIWTEGGDPDRVYLSAFQMNVALGFLGNNNQRSTINASADEVRKTMSVYVTPWGTVEFIPSRHVRSRDVWIMQSDMWRVATARAMSTEELAKTGDSDKRQMVTELTMVSANEKASGGVVDCTT